jgi:DNA-binding response OmpR family regulator
MNSKTKVLLLEDDPFLTKIIVYRCEKAGMEVTALQDGNEALEELRQNKYHALITDIMLESMSGLEFVDELRKSGVRLPILVISDYSSSKVIDQAMNLGANAFMTKPFIPDDLVHQIQKLLQQHAA